METITLYITDALYLETSPDDKRKPISKAYPNTFEGFNCIRRDLLKIIDEAERIHVFHTEVHKPLSG